ncbi:hypothetical protein ACFWP3_31040 [Streptomyces sp. NPDC058525]|uniref:hypothetical protein n=1 Tax=Streptomyces sp. NPDC058525 TaxID=3346538 RepID=UPI0036518A7B
MARRPKPKKKRPALGIPSEIILLTGQGVWPYTFLADDGLGGCGKVAMPSEAAVEEVQAALFTPLADLARTHHGIELGAAWSSLTHDSWVGRVRRVAGPPSSGAVTDDG